MKYCPNCKIKISTKNVKCPICHAVLKDDGQPLTHQEYPVKEERKPTPILIKIFILVSIVAAIASLIVNYFTFDPNHPLYWSVLVLFFIPYAWLLVKYCIFDKAVWHYKVKYMFIYTIALTLLSNMFVCLLKKDFSDIWSIKYVIPGLLIAFDISIFFITLFRVDLYYDAIIHLWTDSAFLIVNFILYLIFKNDIFFMDIIAWTELGVGLITLIAMVIFHHKETKLEAAKRFKC